MKSSNNPIDGARYCTIGKIVGVHGLKGALKIVSYAQSIGSFTSEGCLHLIDQKGCEQEYAVRWAKPHGKHILLMLEGIGDRDQAQALSGAWVGIPKTSPATLEEDTYYWSDIIGLSVLTEKEKYLGCITAIIETGSNDVYVVQHPERSGNKEVLIPALAWVVLNIDIESKTMHVHLPEGL